MQDWAHQTYCVTETRKAIEAGERRICVTGPTGSGKSLIIQRFIEWGYPTVLYANRIALIEQLARGMDEAGIPYGLQASGYAPSVFENVQVASIQTVASRMGKGRMLPHDAKLVIVDEAHNEKGERIDRVIDWHTANGAIVLLVTATPVGLGGRADKLIQFAVNSELFRCGALIPCHTYAPDEPASSSFKNTTMGLLQLKDEVKEVMLPVIIGRVIDHYRKLNPEQKPSILFAPGVEESRWFTEKFNQAGIPWSHIDGERIVLNGVDMAATRENRSLLLEASKSGLTKGVSNRFVLREGLNLPWLAHGIMACTFGSVASYLQAGGRLLRSYPGMTHVVLADHGGNSWRHDSLNSDRHWELGDTEKSLKEKHESKYREKKESEPITCPQCFKVRSHGIECPACKFVARGHRRMVIQTDGTLREVRGDVYRPRKVNTSPEDHKKWKSCVYRCKAKGLNFNQARGLFLRETGTVPGPDFPMLPIRDADWGQKVQDVPYDRLTK